MPSTKQVYASSRKKYVAVAAAKRFAKLANMRVPRGQAKKMLSNASKLSGFVGGKFTSGPQGPEIKKFDNNVTAFNVGTTIPYVFDTLAAIGQGTGANGRIGDRIHVKAMDVLFDVQSLVTTTETFIDLFAIVDLQPDGSTAAAGTIFATTSTDLTFLNVDQLERFRVLKRERINLDPGSGLTTKVQWHIPLDLGVRYGSATTSPNSNTVLICALSPAVSGSYPTVQYVARVSYTDE